MQARTSRHTCFYELPNKHLGDAAHDDSHVQVDLLPHNGLLQLRETQGEDLSVIRSTVTMQADNGSTPDFGSGLPGVSHPFHVASGQRRPSERFVSVELLFCEQLQDAPANHAISRLTPAVV